MASYSVSEVLMEKATRQSELAAFFAREYQNMVRYLRRRTRDLNTMEIEDVISDLMVGLFDRVDLTAGVEDLAAYVYRALGHRLLDWLRKRRRTVPLDGHGAGDGQTVSDLPAMTGDAESEAAVREVRRRLLEALGSLPPKQRAVWIATEIEGYAFRELSAIWNEPLGTLLARKHHAMEALREALGDLRDQGR